MAQKSRRLSDQLRQPAENIEKSRELHTRRHRNQGKQNRRRYKSGMGFPAGKL